MMEAQRSPVIIPMWLTGTPCTSVSSILPCPYPHTGFDKLMPEGRPFPYKFLPRPGADLTITFGEPVPPEDIQNALSSLVAERRMPDAPDSTSGGLDDPARPTLERQSGAVAEYGWLSAPVSHALHGEMKSAETAVEVARVRSAVTAVIQRDVEALGRRVLGLALKS